MRKIREIIRLALVCGTGSREIGRSISISHSSVSKYLKRLRHADIEWETVQKMDDRQLASVLQISETIGNESRPCPDWSYIHQELKRKGVTLQLLWEEYKIQHPDGWQSTQFCEHYSRWKKKLNVTMRQTHKAGEKMFVDYAGQTVDIVNRVTGEVKSAEIFVSTLGASNYTFCRASWTQQLPDWIDCNIRSFEYFQGVPDMIVPDNLKSGVTKACYYEPDINPTYHEMAMHYDTVVMPARSRKPQDKAKVESGVQLVERWILAALRNHQFFSLEQLNKSIRELLVELNSKPFQKLPGSRRSCFEEIDRPALKSLPEARFEITEWKQAKVNIDYHVELKGHYYSTPYRLVGEKIQIRYSRHTVEIFHRGKRIASHVHDDGKGQHSTIKEHMPKSHQCYLEWTPSRITSWALETGPSTARMVESIMKQRKHPQQGYRSCMGIMRLSKTYTGERLENACTRALQINGISYKSVQSILSKGLDRMAPITQRQLPLFEHANVRGSNYFTRDNETERNTSKC